MDIKPEKETVVRKRTIIKDYPRRDYSSALGKTGLIIMLMLILLLLLIMIYNGLLYKHRITEAILKPVWQDFVVLATNAKGCTANDYVSTLRARDVIITEQKCVLLGRWWIAETKEGPVPEVSGAYLYLGFLPDQTYCKISPVPCQ